MTEKNARRATWVVLVLLGLFAACQARTALRRFTAWTTWSDAR